MLGQSGAIAKRPPHCVGFTSPFAVYKTNFTNPATAAVDVLPGNGGIPFGGCWVTFVASADCWVHFSSTGNLTAASSTTGYPLLAGVEYNWWVNDTEDRYISIGASTVDGVLTRYRSNM